MARLLQRMATFKPIGRNGSTHSAPLASRYPVFIEPISPRRGERPAPGSEICERLALFHDASAGNFSWQQNHDLSLTVTAYHFDGSYLSLAAGLEAAVTNAMTVGHQLNVACAVSTSRPLTGYVRLNAAFAEGHQTMFETLVMSSGDLEVAFDLSALETGKGMLRDAWVDLVLAKPAMTALTVMDLKIDLTPVSSTLAPSETTP